MPYQPFDSGLFSDRVIEFDWPLSVLPSLVDWLLKAGLRPQFFCELESDPMVQ